MLNVCWSVLNACPAGACLVRPQVQRRAAPRLRRRACHAQPARLRAADAGAVPRRPPPRGQAAGAAARQQGRVRRGGRETARGVMGFSDHQVVWSFIFPVARYWMSFLWNNGKNRCGLVGMDASARVVCFSAELWQLCCIHGVRVQHILRRLCLQRWNW